MDERPLFVVHLVEIGRSKWGWQPRNQDFYLDGIERIMRVGNPLIVIADTHSKSRLEERGISDVIMRSGAIFDYETATEVLARRPEWQRACEADREFTATDALGYRASLERNWNWPYFAHVHSRFLSVGKVAARGLEDGRWGKSQVFVHLDAGIFTTTGWPSYVEFTLRSKPFQGLRSDEVRFFRMQSSLAECERLGGFSLPLGADFRRLGRYIPAPIVAGVAYGGAQGWKQFSDDYLQFLDVWLSCKVPTLDPPVVSTMVAEHAACVGATGGKRGLAIPHSPYARAVNAVFKPSWPSLTARFRDLLSLQRQVRKVKLRAGHIAIRRARRRSSIS